MSNGSHDAQNTNREREDIRQFSVPLWKIWQHKRYVVAILSFLGFMNLYALRTNISVAIVDMTQLKNKTLANGTIILNKEFEWDSTIQGYILSSFFYGYIFTQILGGFLATKFGGAKVFGFGIATTSALTIVTPWVATIHVYFLIALRILEGALEGVTYPAIQELWSHWSTPSEKSRLVSISISGAHFGAALAMPVCSLLATAYGWETIFYSFGAVGFLWYLIWLLVVADTPAKDKWINPKEVEYITDAIIGVAKSEEKIKVPWCTLLKSTPVLANIVCYTCETWGFYTLLTFLPLMMKSLLGFDLNKTGFLSALPYLVVCLTVQISGHLSDFLITRKYFNTTQVRKFGIVVGFIAQSIFIFLAGYWVSPSGTSFCLVAAIGLGGLSVTSMMTNPLDIAPKFASVIFGITNTVGTIPGIVSPILTGYIVTDQSSVEQWRIVYFISSAIYLFGAITSMIFTSGTRQPWADRTDNSTKTEKKNYMIGYDNNTLKPEESY